MPPPSSKINDDNELITDTQNASSSKRDIITMEKKEDTEKDNRFRWSYDISNIHNNKNGKKFIFVALSRVEVDENMTGKKCEDTKIKNDCKTTIIQTKKGSEKTSSVIIDMQSTQSELKEKQKLEETKGTGIYCIELEKDGEDYVLKKVTCNHYDNISGICRFMEVYSKKTGSTVKRFIVLNFYGMYSFEFDGYFKFTEKFNYPKSIRRELNYWYTNKNCMNRLLSCIYDRYFLVKQHKDNVEYFEGKQYIN
jgi:hypothetical protein